MAIVTGAGGGLGRQHALALAARGAKVVVNDLGGARDGSGGSASAAQAVVDEIKAAGGEAIANGASVTDFAAVQAMVQQAMDAWGRIDILVNNAGILRDKSFAKMDLADFRLVVDVHLMGAVHCTKAVWPIMNEQKYGRIVMTTSSSGLYGNFGQSNYGAAKLALVGLMQTLTHRGREERHPRQLPGAHRGHAHDRGPDAAGGARCAQARGRGAGDAGAGGAGCADAHDPVRGRGHLRGGAHHADQGRIHRHRRRCAGAPGARLSEVTDRHGEQVPQSGAAQGTNEVGKAMANAAGTDPARLPHRPALSRRTS